MHIILILLAEEFFNNEISIDNIRFNTRFVDLFLVFIRDQILLHLLLGVVRMAYVIKGSRDLCE